MRAALACLLVAALAVWWLWPENDEQADRRRLSGAQHGVPQSLVTDRSANGVGPEIDARVARLEESGDARVEGVVTGPAGAVWGARVRIHRAGDPVAFDETGTDTDGRYAMQFAVAASGEELELECVPPKDVPLRPDRSEAIHLAPGSTIRRDVTLAGNSLLRGKVSGLEASRSRSIVLAAVDFAQWEALLQRLGGRYPEWGEVGPLAEARTGASPGFTFAQLDGGPYALVSATSDYAVLDPKPVRPGEGPVAVTVTYVSPAPGPFFDAHTGAGVIVNVEVLDAPSPGYLSRATVAPGGVSGRLRWDGYAERRPRRLRVTAEGYHPAVIEQFVRNGYLIPGANALIPLDAKRITVNVSGPGADQFVGEASLMLHWRAAGSTQDIRSAAVLLERTRGAVTWALPSCSVTAWFQGKGLGLGSGQPLMLDDAFGNDRRRDLFVDSPATLEVVWPDSKRGFALLLQATGPKLEWRAGADGVHRLVAVASTGGVIAMPSRFQRVNGRARVPLPAGTWTIVWVFYPRDGQGKTAHRSVTLVAGATAELDLGH